MDTARKRETFCLIRKLKMSCSQTYNFFEYLEGSLSPDKMRVIDSHLAICNSCQQKFALVHQAFLLLEKKKQVQFNPFLYTRIEQRLIQKERTREKHFKRLLQPALVFTIAFVALFSGYFFGYEFQSTEKNTNTSVYSQYVMQEPMETTLFTE